MKRIDLIPVKHNIKIGDKCPSILPTISQDCILYDNNEPIGFFLKRMPDKMCALANLANNELLSKRVPKKFNNRMSILKTSHERGITNKEARQYAVSQFSTILGGVPCKPMMRRYHHNLSSVHSIKSAQTFVKAMMMLAIESENLLKEFLPKQYAKQSSIFESVDEKWKFGNLFTSSISNYNIAASYHKDNLNIAGCVNVIITKRKDSTGGNVNVPDYNATFDQVDNSILVYPAWRNIHGVTPITPKAKDGYRNSLVFYPLKAFTNVEKQ